MVKKVFFENKSCLIKDLDDKYILKLKLEGKKLCFETHWGRSKGQKSEDQANIRISPKVGSGVTEQKTKAIEKNAQTSWYSWVKML